MCASSSVDTASPFIAPVRFSLTSSNTLGSLKCVAACTIALARFSASAGSANSVEFFMKMPERSEEHTSELQSHLNPVCRLLLAKKKSAGHCATGCHQGHLHRWRTPQSQEWDHP